MDILIIAGIALIIVLVALILIKLGNKKINYKDRIKLENILENEELPEKEADKTTKKPPPESPDVFHPKTNVQDDSISKLTDESLKYYNKGVALAKEKSMRNLFLI